MNLTHKRIAEIRTLVSAGLQLGRTEAEDLLGHNDHLNELCEARARLVLRAESESETLRGLYQMHKQTETREMRDLKAELASLKTGYEAYERVNAELRAECERLKRNRDMWKGQVERQSEMLRLAHELEKQLKSECEAFRKHAPSEEVQWCACGDGYPENSYGSGFMDANGGVCANCDAAQPSVSCPLELFEMLRDGASEEAAQHRQSMGSYRPHRQEVLDQVVRQCDEMIAAAKGVEVELDTPENEAAQ